MCLQAFFAFFCCVIQLRRGYAQNGTPVTATTTISDFPLVPCSACYVIAGFSINNPSAIEGSTLAAATGFTFGPSGIITAGATDNNTYFVFTAFSITSTTLVNGACSTVSGTPTTLSPDFSVAIPSGSNVTAYAASAQTAFISILRLRIGGATCGPGELASIVDTIVTIPTSFSTITIAMSSSAVVFSGTPSRTSSPSMSAVSATSKVAPTGIPSGSSPPSASALSTSLSIGVKAGLGVAIPLGLIVSALLGAYLMIRRRRQLLPHTELDSKSRAEVNGEDLRHEMQGNGGKHELLVQERSQELRGDEAARERTGGERTHELEAPT